MTAKIVVSCDADWHGFPCRGAYPARSDHRPTAIGEAWRHGWDWIEGVGDVCPAHARALTRAAS